MAGEELEKCPVCSSDKYLNPELKFLVNPTCYHKMCESCVARIFTLGPAPCPICSRVLRRHKFRLQTFEDVATEREVDTRRRLSKIFNKAEDDFADLRAYNDYLEEVENLTFNLINGVDVDRTEARVKQYEQQNRKIINANQERKAAEVALQREAERFEREARNNAARRAQEMLLKEEEEREERSAELLSAMQAGADVESVRKQIAERSRLRLEAKQRESEAELQQTLQSFAVRQKGRLQQLRREADTPFSPTLGWGSKNDVYQLQDDYDDEFLTTLKKDKAFIAGGARYVDIYDRALFEAFSALPTSTSVH
ncbi:TFIIH/NER complex subunit [Savitreella phatthalungensis]